MRVFLSLPPLEYHPTSTDLRIAKDRAGPVFFSRETENMFVLTAHLKGFKRERIKIDISRDGNRIAISGDKPVQEIVMKKWIMQKKEVEIKGFRKVFRIPDGVIIDKIKAKYNEKETILSIFMPKSVAVIRGVKIEEVAEEVNEAESSGTATITTPAQAAQLPEAVPAEPKQQDIIKSKEVTEENNLKLPQVQQEEVEEKITPTAPTGTPGDTTEYQENNFAEPMQAEPEKIQQQQSPAEPEEIQQQQSPAVPDENIEAKKVIQEQEPEEPDKVNHKLNHPGHQEEHSTSETQKYLCREASIEQVEQEIKESEKTDKVDHGVLETQDGSPAKEIQNENLLREESTEEQEEQEEIKEIEEQSQTHQDSKTEAITDEQNPSPKAQEVQDEEKLEDGQIEDQTVYREDIKDETEILEGVETCEEVREKEANEKYQEQAPRRNSRFCGPCIFAGSAFFGLLIVLVVQFMRKSSKSKKS